MITEVGALFANDPQHKGKVLLLDLAMVNPCVSSNLKITEHQTRIHLADGVGRKKNKYRDVTPLVTPSSLPLHRRVMSSVHTYTPL